VALPGPYRYGIGIGMKLKTYLDAEGIDQTAFAAAINTTQVAVSRYVSGRRIPRPAIMRRIAHETKGLVGPEDFYGLSERAA
jgi:transcriptional regulator with XRE-family HTH domain